MLQAECINTWWKKIRTSETADPMITRPLFNCFISLISFCTDRYSASVLYAYWSISSPSWVRRTPREVRINSLLPTLFSNMLKNWLEAGLGHKQPLCRFWNTLFFCYGNKIIQFFHFHDLYFPLCFADPCWPICVFFIAIGFPIYIIAYFVFFRWQK